MRLRPAAFGTLLATVAVLGWHRGRNWGSTCDERTRRLPGDELVPDPATTTTWAVSVDAPAPEVWRWLVQIGQDRGGMYSYDWLENLLGLDIHSAEELREEWQHLAVGHRVVLVREGWPPLRAGYSLPVAVLEPGRAIVLRQASPEHPWNAVWSFVIEAEDATACRLISRGRTERAPGVGGLLARAAVAAMEPITLLMTRKMLLGIKHRAERSASLPAGQPERF